MKDSGGRDEPQDRSYVSVSVSVSASFLIGETLFPVTLTIRLENTANLRCVLTVK